MSIHSLMNERSFNQRGEKGNANLNNKRKDTTMKKSALFLIGLMACLAIGASTSRAQIMYSLEDIGTVKNMNYSVPGAISNDASVAGTAYKDGATCAFHYDYVRKGPEDVGGMNSRAFGLNSIDVLVGDTYFGTATGASHAALFKFGYVQDLGVLKNQTYSRANGINALGQIVGYSGPTRDSNQSRAFVWAQQTGMIDLGTLGGAYAQAYAINDGGTITGGSQMAAMGINEITHAFTYNPACMSCGGMTDLGVLGGNVSVGMAINANNHVAGFSTLAMNDNRVHAFLHNGTRMIDLGSLGLPKTYSDVSVALAVNNADQVVGSTYLPAISGMPLQQVAFLWRPTAIGGGQMIDLNKLLYGAGINYVLVAAAGINNQGQIVALAYEKMSGSARAVLLTPQGPVAGRR